MPPLSKDEIIEAISSMSVLELSELSKALQDKFGVTAAAPVVMGGAPVAAAGGGGGEAAAAEEAPTSFDVVLTDETMPELIGTDLAHEIRLLRPDIPIVLMSGYSGAQLNERARAVGVREILRKPLQSKDIAECLGRVVRSLV